MPRSRLLPFAALLAASALIVPALTTAAPGVVDPSVPAARDTEPVVLTGAQFGLDGDWVAPQNITARQPEADLTECQAHVNPSALGNPTEGGAGSLGQTVQQGCPEGYDEHSHYATPDVDTADATGESIKGTPADALRGYRWDDRRKAFVQIPFQVDEVFTRYLDNTASGFAVYSGEDQHTTYAYDREGFRFTESDPNSANPCLARMKPGDHAATDPVKGLDTNDEMAFMASDAGPAAPAGTPLPSGIEGLKTISLQDPTNPSAPPRYVYVMRAGANGPDPAYTAENG